MLKLTFSFSNSVSWQPNRILEHMKKKRKKKRKRKVQHTLEVMAEPEQG